MLNIIFLGAPGSGKGTQSLLIAEQFNIPAISTGEILRKEVAKKSDIGKKAKQYMDSGGLVPDEVVIDIIKNRILESDCNNGFILDGFPRNISQADILDQVLESVDKEINLVVNIDVDSEVLLKRILGRFTCAKCGTVYNKFFGKTKIDNVCDKCGASDFGSRDDDNEDTIKKRLEVYHQQTKDLIEFYRKKGLIYSVDGLKDVALVNLDIANKVQHILRN